MSLPRTIHLICFTINTYGLMVLSNRQDIFGMALTFSGAMWCAGAFILTFTEIKR